MKKTVKILVAACIMIFFPLASFAEEGVKRVFTLNSALETALKENQSIKEAELEALAAGKRYKIEKSLEDPVLMYKYLPRDDGKEEMLELTQELPFPGLRYYKGKAALKEEAAAAVKLDEAKRKTIEEVKKAYYELWYAEEALLLARENEEALENFSKISKSSYGLNVVMLDDVVRARKMSAEAAIDVLLLESMKEAAIAKLNALFNNAPGIGAGTPEDTTYSELAITYEGLSELAFAGDTGLKLSSLYYEKSVIEGSIAKYAYLPKLMVGVTYSKMTEDMPVKTTSSDYGYVFGISLPIWFGKNRAISTEAAFGRDRNRVASERTANELKNEIKRLYFEIKNSEKILKLYSEKFVPEAKESYELAEARYKSGKETLGSLLEAKSLYLSFNQNALKAKKEHLKLLAELERISGLDLTKKARQGNE